MDKLSLAATVREQSRRAAGSSSGRASTTVYGGSGRSLRQTVIALQAGQRLAEHENPGEATVHVLSGTVRLVADGAAQDGCSGDLLTIPPSRHSLEALEDAAVLLTVVKR